MQRVITALILGSLVIVGIFYLPFNGFRLLATLMVALAVWEYAGFFWRHSWQKRLSFFGVFFVVAIVTQFFPAQPTLIVGGLWWLIAPYFLWCYTIDSARRFTNVVWQWFLGLVIFVPCLIGLLELQEKFGPMFLLYLLLIVCAADSGAYFIGMFWGKHPLAAQISPNKTFEGLLGGILVVLLVTVIGALLSAFGYFDSGGIMFNFSGKRGISLLILIILTCLWSVIGDLFASMLKRQVGVKDSGQLLPGHGGMYDRIDSLTAAVPIFVLGLLLI